MKLRVHKSEIVLRFWFCWKRNTKPVIPWLGVYLECKCVYNHVCACYLERRASCRLVWAQRGQRSFVCCRTRAGSASCPALRDSRRCRLSTENAQASEDPPTRAHHKYTLHTHTPTGVRQYDTHALLAIACLWFERCELLDGLDGVVSASRRAVIHAAVVPVAHAGERAWAAKQVQRSHQNPTNTRLPNHGDGSSVQTPPLLNK